MAVKNSQVQNRKKQISTLKGCFIIVASIVVLIIIGSIAGNGSQKATQAPTEPQIASITLNVCELYPNSVDLWQMMPVTLFSQAGNTGITMGRLKACDDIKLDVLETKIHGGIEYYRVRSGSVEGWNTKRVFVGE